MCAVSMIADHYKVKPWKDNYPNIFPDVWPPKTDYPFELTEILKTPKNKTDVTRKEFDDLKKEVEEMKELLKKAIKYDKDNNQPDCHIDEKVEFLKKIAKIVGVDLEEIFKQK